MAKVTQAEANYRDGTASQNCGGCAMFSGSGQCSMVAGKIDAADVCDLYKAAKAARYKSFGRMAAPVEFKFAPDGTEPGTFEGYISVFRNQDSYGDIVNPGAFAQSLAEHKAAGTMPGLYAEHSFAMLGGDPLPIGVWKQMREDEKGLHGVGKISALDSDHGKRIYGLMRDGALTALSIAYSIRDGGVDYGKKAGDPKRWLNSLVLFSADIVSNPANPEAQISAVKSVMALTDRAAALAALNAALTLHSATLAGGDAPTADERAQLNDHLRAAYRALAGDEPKATADTIRLYEDFLQHPDRYAGFSHRMARDLAAHGWKTATQPRDEAAAVAEAKKTTEAMRGIAAAAEALRGLTFAA